MTMDFFLCEAVVNNSQSNSQITYITAVDEALQIADTVKNPLDLFFSVPFVWKKTSFVC